LADIFSNFFKKNSSPSTQTKFDWQAGEGAPDDYPMQIVAGNLSLSDGGSLYVPDGATLHHGWGRGRSSHIVGPELKSLPNRLSLTFFSYTENQFYEGTFDLPYEKILALFQAGHYSPKDKKHITYDEITTGIAPGGAVSVWLTSLDRTVEVFFGQAEKSDTDWSAINNNPDYPREEYVRLAIEESLSSDEIESLQENGIPFGRWADYRPRYAWQLSVTSFQMRNERVSTVLYFNGERDYLDLQPPISSDKPAEQSAAAETRAVPRKMVFVWARPAGVQDLLFEVDFHPGEIFAAFKQLGGEQQPLQLELHIETREDKKSHFVVWLHSEKESLELKRTVFETWGARKQKKEVD